jgi:serine/threonine protein kinase
MNSLCSNDLLESALAGSLTPHDEITLHQHLEECESCGAALEQMAGGSAWSEQAATLLRSDELDPNASTHDDWSIVDFTVEHLEPPEEPNTLGRLGGYDVLEIIGRGGMGVVLKGFDRELKRCVAIKVLAPHLAHSPLARKRFAREAQAAAAVVHPHVLAIHQVQPGGRLPFLVMPLVAGESLAQRIAARGTLELKEILRIGMQAAAGLAAAHEQGLVHRDVKPANILLEKGVERAVLTDFGLARAADDVAMTRWGIIAGTPQYMSPEQAQGQALDGRSDLFSLGCVLYEMATGRSPFRADSTIATLRRLVDDQPAAIVTLNPELPQWFVNIVDRLLEKNPERRFKSGAEVSDLLERCLAHVQQPATVSLPREICFTPDKPYRGALDATRVQGKRSPVRSGFLIGTLALVILFLGCSWMLPPFARSVEADARATSELNLRRLTSALMAYAEEHGHFPASAIYGKDGTGGPPHSWRVEILPYVGHRAVYEQYHFNELWDSEHNSKLLEKIPAVFRGPLDDIRSTHAAYFGVISGDAKTVVAVPRVGLSKKSYAAVLAGALDKLTSSANRPPTGATVTETTTPDVKPGAGLVATVIDAASVPPDSAAPGGTPAGPVRLTAPAGSAIVSRLSVDDFIARKMAAQGLKGLYANDKGEWLRRTTLDLTGTIPSEQEVALVRADESADAMDRAVERLLSQSRQLTRGSITDGIFVPEGSTIFSMPLGARPSDISDGTMQTIAIVEAKRNIPWTKPEDLTYDSRQAASPLGGWYKDGWYAGFADGTVKLITPETSPADVRAFFTIQGGENGAVQPGIDLGFLGVIVMDASLGTATQWRGRFGEQFDLEITGSTAGSIWGTDAYTDDSPIATAAVHAGLVKDGERAKVIVTIVKARRHTGTARNGVTSFEWTNPWESSYILRLNSAKLAAVENEGSGDGTSPVVDAPVTNAVGWRDRVGEQFDVEVTGGDQSTRGSAGIWGADVYTDDSDFGLAAVHCGLLKVGERAKLTVTIVKSPATHLGTQRNGINSLSWGASPVSFLLQRKSPLDSADNRSLPRAYRWLGSTERNGARSLTMARPSAVGPHYRLLTEGPAWANRTIEPSPLRDVQMGNQLEVEVIGSATGTVWGTEMYTSDSDVATAAVHAGLVRLHERARITVTLVKSPSHYTGSTSHGIRSHDYGAFPSGFLLRRSGGTKTSKSPAIEESEFEMPFSGDELQHNALWKKLLTVGDGDQIDRAARQRMLELGRNFGATAQDERLTKPWFESLRLAESVQLKALAFDARVASSDHRSWGGIRWDASLSDPTMKVGLTVYCAVTGTSEGWVWGVGPYTTDSNLGKAAVHAGLLRDGEAGVLKINIVKGREAFACSTANGVSSQPFGHYDLAMTLERLPSKVPETVGTAPTDMRQLLLEATFQELDRYAPDQTRVAQFLHERLRDLHANSDLVLPAPPHEKFSAGKRDSLTSFRGRVGQSFHFLVQGAAYGISRRNGNVFSLDSQLSHSVVKAKLIKPGESAVVRVQIVKIDKPLSDLTSEPAVAGDVGFILEKPDDRVFQKFSSQGRKPIGPPRATGAPAAQPADAGR